MADIAKVINAPVAKGKKGKKKRVQMTLAEFIGSSNANAPVIQSSSNWADEMEDINPDDEQADYKINREALPSAPKSVLNAALDESLVPKVPPFTAFVSNLPFDVHHDDITKFFKNLTVLDIRLQKDGMGRSRGFGHIDFESREMLIDAIGFNELKIKNRAVKIGLEQEREKRDTDYRKDPEDDKTASDWRKAPTKFSEDNNREGDKGGERGYRGGSEHFGRKKEGTYDNQDKWRASSDSFSNREGYNNRDRDSQDRFSDNNRFQSNNRYDRNDNRHDRNDNRYERNDNRHDRNDNRHDRNDRPNDNTEKEWRRKDSKDESSRADSTDRSSHQDKPRFSHSRANPSPLRSQTHSDLPPPAPEGPKERPKLIMKPRTKPLESTTTPSPTSSIFGNAKPVDTAAKERELEEKLKQKLHEPKGSKDHTTSDDNNSYHRQASSESGQSTSDAAVSSEDPLKVLPAPPPKVNAWSVKRAQQPTSSPHLSQSDTTANNTDQNTHTNSSRPLNSESPGDSKDQHNSGRGDGGANSSQSSSSVQKKRGSSAPWKRGAQGGRGGVGRPEVGGRGSSRGGSRGAGSAEQLPLSIEDMPKMEAQARKDWSNRNKFDTLQAEEENDGGDEDDSKHEDAPSDRRDKSSDGGEEEEDGSSWSQVRHSKAHERLEQ